MILLIALNVIPEFSTMAPIKYTFLSNHNIHKSLCGLCFWAPDPLINRTQLKSLQHKTKARRTFMNVVIQQKVYLAPMAL